jgi:ArsR family metal-binding transcriptional regulator
MNERDVDIDIDGDGEVSVVARFRNVEEALEKMPGLEAEIMDALARSLDGADPDQDFEFRLAQGGWHERTN